ncbi:putative XRE-type DNA-binding protein [Methylorubrum rhodinum]|uniref:Putative XRE-type DNA-binding protein n=1 Tax=Methylorubrum rhodinum TaxID=29428 RepID=A0A840ZJ77_9HYPH|nr:XRE family transcriptional regulator [Methylorubrum rhodinum]MBB5758009.1 putative XRE-type DNA-binding protein [Methylorubrum rhodinum]
MNADNPHIGSSFESWLDEEGLTEEITAAAAKSLIAEQIAAEMKRQKISKVQMAERMRTSRAQVDRLLDPSSGGATLETLVRAARAVGRELRVELV